MLATRVRGQAERAMYELMNLGDHSFTQVFMYSVIKRFLRAHSTSHIVLSTGNLGMALALTQPTGMQGDRSSTRVHTDIWLPKTKCWPGGCAWGKEGTQL